MRTNGVIAELPLDGASIARSREIVDDLKIWSRGRKKRNQSQNPVTATKALKRQSWRAVSASSENDTQVCKAARIRP